VAQRLYSLTDLADALGVNRTLVAMKVKAGLIQYSYQVRDEVLFTGEQIDAYAAQERQARRERRAQAESARQERIARRHHARQERINALVEDQLL
jgi:hypothetical protein